VAVYTTPVAPHSLTTFSDTVQVPLGVQSLEFKYRVDAGGGHSLTIKNFAWEWKPQSPPPPPLSPPAPPSPPSPPPPGTFTTKASLQTAVQAFNDNPAAATATYGLIADWDVSAITDT